MSGFKNTFLIILLMISLCKIYLICLGINYTYSKSKIAEVLLPLVFIYLSHKRNRYTWIAMSTLLLVGIYEIYFVFPISSFFPIFFVINPILEIIKYYNLSDAVYRVLFHVPSVLLPICFLFLLSKWGRTYYYNIEY